MTDITGTKRAAEKRSAQAEEASARMAAVTEGGIDLIRNAMLTTQDYNAKVLEFATANCNATIEYLSKLSGTKTPSELIELTTR